MRLLARKPFGAALGEGEVVDGYVVESFVADRGHAELICDAVGPDAEPVTLAVAWRAPADKHAWPRFRRLARTRAALEHEALVPVHAVGDYFGRPYLAMDRYPEATFEELIASAPLPAHEVLALFAPVGDALDLAHAKGLVHQSLSDTSLLMEGDSLLLDGFGLAGGPRELSFESVDMHEVRYCPPEELRGEPLQPASNVYSLTGLLVHALTGSTPYRGVPAAHAYGHLVEPPPVPSAQMPRLGRAFDEVVARGMAKDPAQRPASAGELLREAAAALGVELPESHPSGEGQGRGRRRRRGAVRIRRVPKSAVAATAIVAAVAGIAAGVVLDPFEGSRASAAGGGSDAQALARLDDQRTPLRARLATADTPQEQAAAAAELADAYGRAAGALEPARLASAARMAERAYEELAAAADAGSAERFAAASDEVTRADARLRSIAADSR
jgi:hypothetical protein